MKEKKRDREFSLILDWRAARLLFQEGNGHVRAEVSGDTIWKQNGQRV
jgi:hypothetical protein